MPHPRTKGIEIIKNEDLGGKRYDGESQRIDLFD
jgi:hypothetical protein